MPTDCEKQAGYDEVIAALAEPPKPSARELELLTLMADGLTDAEIAEKLSISARTMRSRLHALRMKIPTPWLKTGDAKKSTTTTASTSLRITAPS